MMFKIWMRGRPRVPIRRQHENRQADGCRLVCILAAGTVPLMTETGRLTQRWAVHGSPGKT